MKNLLILTIVALSSCAYKSDPGLEKLNAGFAITDSLKGKMPAEVLKLKYSGAVILCKLERTPSEAPLVTKVAQPQEENEVSVDLMAWSAADPELKPVVAKIMNTVDGQTVTVNLSLKPEIGTVSFKQGPLVYLMKYSPHVTYSFTAEAGTEATDSFSGGILERVLTKTKVASKVIGQGANAKKYDYLLGCSIETIIIADSKNAVDFESQFQILDCSAPKENQKDLITANCKN